MARLGPSARRMILAAAVVWAGLLAARAQDRIADLQALFNHESDPIRKAKILPRLGDAQFDQVRAELVGGQYAHAVEVLQEYRDEVKGSIQALKATGVDAERRPAGFKQIQMHVRKGIRELDQTILSVPEDERERFAALRKELLGIEKELIDLLFPRQPGKGPNGKKPKG